MGRPRLHGEQTAGALLDAAERIVETDGIEALTVRRVAEEVRTTTRAVYTIYGSKDGLVVALGRRAFDLLGAAVEALPATDDPAADLVEAGARVFRRFALDHPALYRVGVQWGNLPDPDVAAGFMDAASAARASLERRVARLEETGGLGRTTVRDATRAFHAFCEGLAGMELRGALPRAEEDRVWRSSLAALLHGFSG